jgi:hypothetical protein
LAKLDIVESQVEDFLESIYFKLGYDKKEVFL